MTSTHDNSTHDTETPDTGTCDATALEFARERTYLQFVHDVVDAIRDGADRELRREYLDHSHHRQNLFDREARVAQLRTLLRNLTGHQRGLCFGKLVEAGYDDPVYIGRCGVADEQYNQLLVDWRAPVAEAFYRATAIDPMGMQLRRHFMYDQRTLVGMEDDLLTSALPVGSQAPTIVGEAALLSALNRDRTGHMGDIVATIQRDQDSIIRAPMRGALVVSGGPGTGKTVVALHRAAYLLFTHRARIENNGVLVMGPSSLFLQYIERVLPSLGESMVLMKNWANLLPGITGVPETDPTVADLKGSLQMVDVLRNAVALCSGGSGRRGTRPTPLEVLGRLLTQADILQQAAEPVVGDAWRDLLRPSAHPWTISDLPLIDELGELMGTMAVPLLEQQPRISAEERAQALELASAMLSSMKSGDGDEGGADLSNIVTAEQIVDAYLGEDDVPSMVEMARGDSSWQFAHVVVDEAQDVSAMQWRALNRRCLGRSMTIVGDPDQQTHPDGDWWLDRIKAGLCTDRLDVRSLHINYRTPAELVRPAQMLRARTTSPDTVPTQYVRSGATPWAVHCPELDDDAIRDVVERAKAELGERGRLAVICANRHAGRVERALAGVDGFEPSRRGERLVQPVSAYLADEVKGLEFDSVVVVDPKAIQAECGWRQLYVVLTRPTRHLCMVLAGEPSTFEAQWLADGAVLQPVC